MANIPFKTLQVAIPASLDHVYIIAGQNRVTREKLCGQL